MFCKQCGAKMAEGVKFCGACGTVIETAETPEPNTAPSTAIRKFSNKHIGIAACGAVALIAVIIILAVTLSGGGAEGTINRYVRAMGSFDVYRAQRYHAFEISDVLPLLLEDAGMSMSEFNAELYDLTGTRTLRAFYSELADEVASETREMFGRNIRVTHEVISYRQLTPQQRMDEINRVRNSLSWVGIELEDLIRVDRMHEMVTYTINVTLSGSLGDESHRETLLLVRIGRNWYVWQDPLDLLWDLPGGLRF